MSSPIESEDGPKPEYQHDFIDVNEFPKCGRRKKITIEDETKGKDVAVEKLPTDVKNEKKTGETWFVYILRCEDGTLYTGITNDLPRRCDQHNAGTASRYTRSRLPAELVYQEIQTSRSLALKRELAIKGLSRQEKDQLIRDARQ